MDQKAETAIELKDALVKALGRELTDLENEIVTGIIESGKERRIAFSEMIKEVINKNNKYTILD